MVAQARPAVVRIDTDTTTGSGAIFDTQGQTAYIITNHHVIEDGSTVTVTVNDSAGYTATVLGVDRTRDLAVIRICCGRFQKLTFGNPDRLKLGDEIIAIGYALGFQGSATITRGIVSAIRYHPDYRSDVIQTDAAVNPGNSGGPMLSLNGQIIGINTYGYSETQAGSPLEGLNFAISVTTVQQLIPTLRTASARPTPTPTRRPTATPRPTPTPQPTPVPLTFTSVSVGRNHACGVKTNGSVVCWGSDYYGESTPPSSTFTSVSAGYFYTCGVKTNGSVVCWGNNDYGEATPPSGAFASVSASNYPRAIHTADGFIDPRHTCGVKTNGSVVCWGNNIAGQAKPPSGTFASISAGSMHTCGIKTDRSLICWGYYPFGAAPPSGAFASVSAGGNHACGVKTNGSVICWGGDWVVEATPPSGTFASVSAGYGHTCGVKTNGSVVCWGGNPAADIDGETPEANPPSGTFASVSAGDHHTCGVKTNGSVVCWGRGETTPPN